MHRKCIEAKVKVHVSERRILLMFVILEFGTRRIITCIFAGIVSFNTFQTFYLIYRVS